MKFTTFVFVLLLYDSHGASLRGLLESCEPCSKEVCCLNECSKDDPFVCTKGSAKGGCNNGKEYWPGTIDCDHCCDLSDCDLETCGRVEPETCGVCPLNVCANHECSDKHPYVCIEGDAVRGCNAGEGYWTETKDNCSKCCDLKTCAGRIETPCEKQCSSEVCSKHECATENPFACTKGGTADDATNPTYGCNANKDYWVETDLNCQDCCDVRKCPEAAKVEPPITTVPETTETPCAGGQEETTQTPCAGGQEARKTSKSMSSMSTRRRRGRQ